MTTQPQLASLFGRKYQLYISGKSPNGTVEKILVSDSTLGQHALRFTFNVHKFFYQAFWFADIEIYNADGPLPNNAQGLSLSQLVIEQGMNVEIRAGYDNGRFGTIWEGQIFQPFISRKGVVDNVLRLNCIQGLYWGPNNFINFNLPALQTVRQEAETMAQNASTPIPISQASLQQLDGAIRQPLPRAQTIFGDPLKRFGELTDSSNMIPFMGGNGLQISSPQNVNFTPIASYAPIWSPGSTPQSLKPGIDYTLVDTPVQTLIGVDFSVLLDSRLDIQLPLSTVHLASEALIELQALSIGSYAPRPLSSTMGNYVLIGVEHTGDTRGELWRTNVTGVEYVEDMLLLLGQNG